MKRKDVRVLLVDDETSLLDAMRRLLELEGFQVKGATSGREAIDLCRAAPYNIVFLDINMPELNGLETYRRLREIAPELPVIMITGYGRTLKPLIEQAREIGVKGCIDKPFRIHKIIESIRTWVPCED